jgi:hypothetical protein
MKKVFIILFLAVSSSVLAGNHDRAGSAGASELLVNPWVRSSALSNANAAFATGIESSFMNIAGLAMMDKTEIKLNHTFWMGQGAGINFTAAAVAQRISSQDVIYIGIQAMNYGDIMITTEDLPEGGIGTFSPSAFVFNLGYARAFTKSIYAGINIKVINEAIANVKGLGVAFDIGLRYVTGEKDNIKFGIALKNVGTPIRYSGDALAVATSLPSSGYLATTEQRSNKFELPTLLNISASYDFIFDEMNNLTWGAQFTANAYGKDQISTGLDYSFTPSKGAAFHLMAGYLYENGIFNEDTRSTALLGPSFGAAVDVFLNDKGSTLGFEYSYRFAAPFAGIHTFGLVFNLK